MTGWHFGGRCLIPGLVVVLIFLFVQMLRIRPHCHIVATQDCMFLNHRLMVIRSLSTLTHVECHFCFVRVKYFILIRLAYLCIFFPDLHLQEFDLGVVCVLGLYVGPVSPRFVVIRRRQQLDLFDTVNN